MFQFAPWPYLLGQVSREIVVEPRVFSRKNKQEAAGLESKESKEKKHILYEQTGLYVAFFFSFPQILMQAKRSFTST